MRSQIIIDTSRFGSAEALRAVAGIASELAAAVERGEPAASSYAERARRLIRARQALADRIALPGYGDPAQNLLLELFALGEERREVSVTGCAFALQLPATTAIRCFALLERQGLVQSTPHPADRRRRMVKISVEAREAVLMFLESMSPT